MSDDNNQISNNFQSGMFTNVIDQAVREAGHGSATAPISLNYWGFNKFGQRSALLPINRDNVGYTFFTRPLLNLSYDNLLRIPKLSSLATSNFDTPGGAIRSMLDWRGTFEENRYSNRFDNQQAFIPLLTNTLESIGGFPDVTIDTFQAAPGNRKETWAMYDGQADINDIYQVTANFKNIIGDPITALFDAWTVYGSSVYLGDIWPSWHALVENYIDYQTRIYRIVLDQKRQFVTKIGAPYAAMPVSNPVGLSFNYAMTSEGGPYNKDNQTLPVSFMCIGFEHNTYQLINDFNKTIELFNPNMKQKEKMYRKIGTEEYQSLNFYGYPYIDIDTNEFQWWIQKEVK